MRIYITGVCLIILGSAAPIFAQTDSGVWFRNLGLEEGLPSTTIYDIHQDRKGFIWATTQAGIVRYEGYNFKTYKIPPEDGIPSSNLADFIIEDHDSVIWVGYQDNHYIARYDSMRGQFDYLDMRERLDINGEIQHTRLLGIDNQNNLWASLLLRDNFNNSVLIKIDTKNLTIHPFTDEEGNSTLEHSHIGPRFFAGQVNYNVFLPQADGVWIGAEDGLNFISNENEVTTYTDGDKGFKGTYVNHLLEVNNNLWVASDSGLVVFDYETKKFSLLDGLKNNPAILHLYKDNADTIWFTGQDNSYKYKDGEITELNTHPDLKSWGAVSMGPQIETEDKIWFINRRQSTNQETSSIGFTIYDKENDSFRSFRSNFKNLGLKSGANITKLLKGKSGSIWLGTMYSGLYQFPRKQKKFGVYFDTEKFQKIAGDYFFLNATKSPNGHIFASLSNGKLLAKNAFTEVEQIFEDFEILYSHSSDQRNYINRIYFEQPGEMYVATERSGFNRIIYDPKTLEIKEKKIWLPEDINGATIVNMTRDNEGNLWLGTTDGVVKADLDNEKYSVIKATDTKSFRQSNNFSSDVLKDSKGNIWYYNVALGGVKRLNPKEGTAFLFNKPNDDIPEQDQLPFVRRLVEMDNGDIFAIADFIYKLNEDSSLFERFMELPIPNMVSIDESEQGNLVIGTYGEGVFWIDPQSHEIVDRLTAKDGLANSNISDIKIDPHENYWLQTSLGLSKYNPHKDALVNYYENHGLPASESQTNFRFRGNDSTFFPIWISNKGLSSVDIHQIKTNTYSPSPVFTNVTAGGDSLPLMDHNGVSIPHNKNDISFAFSSLQFDDPTKNQYRYTLGDEEWSLWSHKRSVQFAKLSPGTYTLKIQSRNPDMIPSATSASYTFNIIPPWYQSTLAYLLYIIFGIGGLAYTAFWYSNYRTEQKAIRMRAEQAEELAKLDQMKTNLLTNISHELRTPLTLILGPIKQLRKKADELGHDWKRRLDIAQRNGNRLRQLVEQVLDLTRLDAQQLELDSKNIELTSFLRRVTESFESMAEQNGIVIKINLPDKIITLQADPDKLEKSMVNLLSNAIKFTPSDGIVRLKLSLDEEKIKISISDTGRGISAERLPHIFDRFHSTSEKISGGGKGLGVGLAITKKYIELHNGTISVESEEEAGTQFTIALPVNTNSSLEDHETTDIQVEDMEIGSPPSEVHPSTNLFDEPYTVLIVEDNDDMLTYIADLLNDKQLMVETAKNGLEAKKRLSIIKPDLIISDIMMPKIDGFALAEHLRSHPEYRLIPIVMLSARAEIEDRIQGYEIGVSDYLVKPFNESELKARVNNLLKLKKERDQQINRSPKEETESDEQTSFVQKLQDYALANIEREVTVEEMCDHINVSRRQIYRKLKGATGFTPAEFVREIRLNEARTLLEKKEKETVAEVSYAVGFSTTSHFSQLFKSRYGRLPSEYM